jgi:hypothetical protein
MSSLSPLSLSSSEKQNYETQPGTFGLFTQNSSHFNRNSTPLHFTCSTILSHGCNSVVHWGIML